MARSKSKLNLRDSQVQARTGLVFSIASTVFMIMLAVIVLQNFNPAEKTIAYNPSTFRAPAIYAAAGVSGLLAAIGFGLGVASLGHRRNARQRESWVGFLLGALVVCLTIVLLAMFKMFSLRIVV
ncbi:MAG: hypothetical protein JXQ73_24530 [Phycisphaerae bacterium]|nr:hypothetical protein [Phycisphaerae bacterium]